MPSGHDTAKRALVKLLRDLAAAFNCDVNWKQCTRDLPHKGPRRPEDIKAKGGWGIEVRFGNSWNLLFPLPFHPHAPGRIST